MNVFDCFQSVVILVIRSEHQPHHSLICKSKDLDWNIAKIPLSLLIPSLYINNPCYEAINVWFTL